MQMIEEICILLERMAALIRSMAEALGQADAVDRALQEEIRRTEEDYEKLLGAEAPKR